MKYVLAPLVNLRAGIGGLGKVGTEWDGEGMAKNPAAERRGKCRSGVRRAMFLETFPSLVAAPVEDAT